MSAFQITGLDHIQIAIPPRGEAAARAFYVDVLQMREVQKPAELQGRGGLWLVAGSLSLHLGTEKPFAPARKAHPALAVDDLSAAEEALSDHIIETVSRLPGIKRFFVRDPFGNRIEIMQRA